jgi:hypothetical protein
MPGSLEFMAGTMKVSRIDEDNEFVVSVSITEPPDPMAATFYLQRENAASLVDALTKEFDL